MMDDSVTIPWRMERFHESYPGLPDLWHTCCDEHPNWGTCGTEEEAIAEIQKHVDRKHIGGAP